MAVSISVFANCQATELIAFCWILPGGKEATYSAAAPGSNCAQLWSTLLNARSRAWLAGNPSTQESAARRSVRAHGPATALIDCSRAEPIGRDNAIDAAF